MFTTSARPAAAARRPRSSRRDHLQDPLRQAATLESGSLTDDAVSSVEGPYDPLDTLIRPGPASDDTGPTPAVTPGTDQADASAGLEFPSWFGGRRPERGQPSSPVSQVGGPAPSLYAWTTTRRRD